MRDRVVVVGHNVRNVAESARKFGWKVFALTKYVDADLKLYAKALNVDGLESKDLAKLVDEIAESLNAKVVLASGCEDLPVKSEVLGVDHRTSKKIIDKLKFYRTLERAGIPFPEIEFEPPCIVKPVRGGGGLGIRLVNHPEDVPKGYICQRFIEGIPCSVSLIASERWVRPIAVNRILVGWREMNSKDFVYCGNLTPLVLDRDISAKIIKIAVEVAELFEVIGSIGVDFVLSDEPFVLEMNPRFQGSLDSIEWSYDVNLFGLHVRACEGKKFEVPKPKRFACRAILFADEEMRVSSNLAGNGFFADVPNVGEVISEGDPVVSILASGNSGRVVMAKVIERKSLFLSLTSQTVS